MSSHCLDNVDAHSQSSWLCTSLPLPSCSWLGHFLGIALQCHCQDAPSWPLLLIVSVITQVLLVGHFLGIANVIFQTIAKMLKVRPISCHCHYLTSSWLPGSTLCHRGSGGLVSLREGGNAIQGEANRWQYISNIFFCIKYLPVFDRQWRQGCMGGIKARGLNQP